MTLPRTVDVIVAGGGVAGASVAAALGDLGYSVLIAEPGLDSGKRLAGELVHPPGAADFAELGLLAALTDARPVPIRGFAVWPDAPGVTPAAPATAPHEPGPAGAYLLPYAEVPGLRTQGFALEHGALTGRLLRAAAGLPHVSLRRGTRVTAIDLDRSDAVAVTLSSGRQEHEVRARLLVAADGAASGVRRMAGIDRVRTRISHMLGYVVEGSRLPHPAYAHVFLGGPAPALAYHVAPETVRVMFDVPGGSRTLDPTDADQAYLGALPKPFREDVRRALASRTALVSANYSVVPEAVVRGRLVLVGDAAGSCHPLTATGLSVCTRDAIRLRAALREAEGDVPRALCRYAALREGPQRTRVALAQVLYDAFAGQTPEMRALRRGILRYWKRSRQGRAISMALLSTHEGRMSVMAREYARAVGHALIELMGSGAPEHPSLGVRGRAALELSRAIVRYATDALRGARGFA